MIKSNRMEKKSIPSTMMSPPSRVSTSSYSSPNSCKATALASSCAGHIFWSSLATSASAGTWQVSPSYDLNYMNTTKIGSQVTGDAARQRFTQSLLLETGYAISDQVSLSAMVSYIFQSRIINGPVGRNKDAIHGIGDAVILLTT